MDMIKKSILIAEDDMEICEFYKVLLDYGGFIVHITHTGYDTLVALGLEIKKNDKPNSTLPITPDLIILDMSLPEIDGYTIATRLLQDEITKKLPIIVISARSQMADVFNQLPNVKCFIVKPFDPKSIIEKMNEIIEK